MIAFFRIALFACSNEIDPRIGPALCARYHMIDGQIAFGATILTLKIVAFEYILPGKINPFVRGINISVEAYDRWHRKSSSDRMQFVPIGRFDQLAFI